METREQYRGREIVIRIEGDGVVRLEIDGTVVSVRPRHGRYVTVLTFTDFETPIHLAKALIDQGAV